MNLGVKSLVNLAVLFALSNAAAISIAQAEPATTAQDSPRVHELAVFEHPLSFHFPHNWRLAYSEHRGDMFSAEFVPNDEFLNKWSSLYCVQSFKNKANSINAEAFLDTFADNYRHSCQGEVNYNKIGSQVINGQPAFSALLSCSKMPLNHSTDGSFGQQSLSEIGHFTVVQGQQHLYLMHHSARGVGSVSVDIAKAIQAPDKAITGGTVFK
ncbi:hypothetical protein FLM48_16635 [Shewanella sp. Scap07]|uniref:hypothetical protein n=1 Tax=Shewanella sp. Scap07 TaxID=2589987 RepID=UPI0015BAF17E|nr:hypothetical protein [Shewanella sp. Scap07]QLE86550.1 hypothetical protein FLM48_16635 [Shewanella sp. Scap07]